MLGDVLNNSYQQTVGADWVSDVRWRLSQQCWIWHTHPTASCVHRLPWILSSRAAHSKACNQNRCEAYKRNNWALGMDRREFSASRYCQGRCYSKKTQIIYQVNFLSPHPNSFWPLICIFNRENQVLYTNTGWMQNLSSGSLKTQW